MGPQVLAPAGGAAGEDKTEQAIFQSTKDLQLAETSRYRARWADRFNETIGGLTGPPDGPAGPSEACWRAVRAMFTCARWCPAGWRAPGAEPFVRAMHMSVTDQWNDMYLAHAYPFLYARKLRYAFASHAWERFLIIYGKMGLHILVLQCLTSA